MEKHKLPGTIRLYGTPAEETVIGKVYMALDGVFNDLDVCLHWHPADRNEAASVSSKANVTAKFTFEGTAAHASVSPKSGRSALDGVELMNVGANFMREHLKEDARVHYVVTDGGGAPNVVPAKATVWYFVRADDHADAERNFAWLQDIARGAALMSQTKMSMHVDTDCHEIIPNSPLAELLTRNLEAVGEADIQRLRTGVRPAVASTVGGRVRHEVHRTAGRRDSSPGQSAEGRQGFDRRGRYQSARANGRSENSLFCHG